MDAVSGYNGESATSDEQGNKKSRRTRRANKSITLDHAENQGCNNVDEGDSNGREQRPACAACKHNRKSCKSDCVLALYFPASTLEEYKQVNDIFGHEKTKKLMNDAAEEKKTTGNGSTEDTVKSLIWEARCWKKDPIGGPHAKYQELLKENQILLENNRLLSVENSKLSGELQNQLLLDRGAVSNHTTYGLPGFSPGSFGNFVCNVEEGSGRVINNSNINFNLFQTTGSFIGGDNILDSNNLSGGTISNALYYQPPTTASYSMQQPQQQHHGDTVDGDGPATLPCPSQSIKIDGRYWNS